MTPTGSAVRVHYSLTNRSDGPIFVVNRLPGAVGAGIDYRTDRFFATAGAGSQVVLSQAAFDAPGESCSLSWAAPHPIGVTRLAPGTSAGAAFVAPLPLHFAHPFGTAFCDGSEGLPPHPATVTFCLGVIVGSDRLDRELGPRATAIVTHEAHWPQHLFCTDPVDL